MTPDTLTVGRDNIIELRDLFDVDTQTYLDAATVTHTLSGPDGADVAGETARPCAFVEDSNATYRAIIPVTAPIIEGSAYRGTYAAFANGKQYTFRVDYLATRPAL